MAPHAEESVSGAAERPVDTSLARLVFAESTNSTNQINERKIKVRNIPL